MAGYRTLALEHSTEEVYAIGAQSAAFREMTKITLVMVAERDKRIASLQRQLEAVKDEYAAHRERTMLALITPEERASLQTVRSGPPAPRTYTSKHGTTLPGKARPTRYIPVNAGTDPQDGAGA